MTEFNIGDEEYLEEVNTSYDQEQPIGDTPSHYPAGGAEPIDAQTGQDFLDIKTGGKREGLGESCVNCGKPQDDKGTWHEKDWQCEGCDMDDYFDKEFSNEANFKGNTAEYFVRYYRPDVGGTDKITITGWHELVSFANRVGGIEEIIRITRNGNALPYTDGDIQELEQEANAFSNKWGGGESLNKDGTGIKKATRGINPNKTPLGVVRFVYVSNSDCKICKEFDGHAYAIDSPNRPVIPRLESQGKKGSRPYTHPHCKCKWVGVFNKEPNRRLGEARANEFLDIEDDDYLRIRFHDKDGNTYCNYCGERFYQETNEEITRHYKGHEDGTLEYRSHSYAPPPPDLFSKKYNPQERHVYGDFGYENKGNEIKKTTVDRAKKHYGNDKAFDKLGKYEQRMIMIDMLKSALGHEMEDPIKTQRKEEMNLLRSYGIDDRTLKDLGLLEADEFDPSLLTIGLPAVADIISGFVSDPEILDVIHHAGVPIHDMTAEMITSVIDGFKAKLQLLHGVEFNPNHSSQDGKFTSGGGGSKVVGASRDQLKRYGKDFGKGKQTQNKDKVVAKFTKDFPEYSSDFAIDQLEKADVLRQRGKIVNDKIMKEFGNAGLNDTIITGRIKESNSVLHKLGVSKEMSDVNDLYDISGVRAMAKDIGGVQEAMDYVRNNYDVISEKNNIDQDRHGYRSYHAIVMKDGIKHEIQIRTVNQETWANWTHDNFYKPATKRLMKFYNTNKEVITSYSVGMSKYFYELDLGLKPTKPDCPPVILQVIGCLG